MTRAAIKSKAVKLALKKRGQLSARLNASPDQADPVEVKQMWLSEAQRRYQELRAGRAKLVLARIVMEHAHRKLSST